MPPGSVPAKTACKDLAAWENSAGGQTIGDDTALQEEFAATTMPLSGDYAAWVSEVQTGNPDPGAAANKVASDCAAYGVTIFPPATPSPAPSSAVPAQTVTFEVSGSYAQVTYGPAGSNNSGTVPMDVTEKLGSPLYYALTAQLQGGGTVTCEIKVDGKVLSKSTASGGYNIAQCEISQDPLTGGWENTNGG